MESVQVCELKSLARKKTPAARMAKKLKRSEGATRQKAFSMGLSLDKCLTNDGYEFAALVSGYEARDRISLNNPAHSGAIRREPGNLR